MSKDNAWRSAAAAQDFADHQYPDFAQEFLRRNMDYRRDYRWVAREISDGRMTAAAASEAVSKWGLVFCLRS